MIAVLSPDYIHAKYCRRELRRADTLGRPIYPILLQDISPMDWPIEIQTRQYIDFRAWRDPAIYRRKLEEMLATLKAGQSSQFTAPPDAETNYLISLIAQLEASKGVLEYVELSAEGEVTAEQRPHPDISEAWAPEFTLLLDPSPQPPSAAGIARDTQQYVALHGIRNAAERFPQFILLGEPGAGKTTALRRLVIDAARRRLERPRGTSLPLLLYLPSWGDNQDLGQFIHSHWPLASDPPDSLSQGEIAFYFDGLNEMGATSEDKARQLRAWLHAKATHSRVIFTCREADYGAELELAIPKVLVMPMGRTQIERFVSNYLRLQQRTDFLSEIAPRPGPTNERDANLWTLARNPYLLTALIYLYQHSPSGTLPSNTGMLFRRLTSTLWAREAHKGTLGWVPFDQMEQRLAPLAFAMINDDMSAEIPLDYALHHVTSAQLLQACRSASTVSMQGNQVRFYHQLLQDYFAAVALLDDKHDKRKLIRIPKWHQAVIAWSGLVENADYVLEGISSPWTYIGRGFKASHELRYSLGQGLLDDLYSSSHYDYDYAIPKLIELGAEMIAPVLDVLRRGDEGTKSRALHVLGFIGNAEIVAELAAYLTDANSDLVIRYAAGALKRIGTPEAAAALASWQTERESTGS